MASLLVVLILDVHVKRLNVFGLSVTPVFVKSQVIISQLAFVLPHVLDKRFVLSFESDVSLVVLINIFHLLLHLLNLGCNLNVLLFKQVAVVIAVVDLAARSDFCCVHAHHAMVCDWPVYTGYFGVVTHTSVIDFFLRSCEPLSSSALSGCGALSHLNLNYIR